MSRGGVTMPQNPQRSWMTPMLLTSVIVGLFLLGNLCTWGQAEPGCVDCDEDGVTYPADCNDADPTIYPGAPEPCDGFDNDCDGEIDNDPACERACEFPDLIRPPRQISSGEFGTFGHSLVWTGSSYGIAWSRLLDATVTGRADLFLTLMDTDGAPQGPDVFLGNSPRARPSLVWTGSELVSSWYDPPGIQSGVFLQRIEAGGTPIGSPLQVTQDGNAHSLVWNGSGFGLARVERALAPSGLELFFTVLFRGLDRFGSPTTDDVIVSADFAWTPSLAWADGSYGIVWGDLRTGGREVYFAGLSPSGTLLVPETPISQDPAGTSFPSIRWTGTSFVTTWGDFRLPGGTSTYLSVVDPSGNELVDEQVLVSAPSGHSSQSLAWNGREHGFAWARGDVIFWRLDELGNRIGRSFQFVQPNQQLAPNLVWDGAGYGVSWQELESRQIFFARIGCDCPDGDGDGTTICNECDDSDPSVFPGALDLPGDAVDADCDGVVVCDPRIDWANHGAFVRCVVRACASLVDEGHLPASECERITAQAARSRVP